MFFLYFFYVFLCFFYVFLSKFYKILSILSNFLSILINFLSILSNFLSIGGSKPGSGPPSSEGAQSQRNPALIVATVQWERIFTPLSRGPYGASSGGVWPRNR